MPPSETGLADAKAELDNGSAPGVGASAGAIAFHYDLGTEFFRLWLDETLTYSAALWAPGDTLDMAQRRKFEHHATQVSAGAGMRVLDIGCGWGGLLQHLSTEQQVHAAVGLTLSGDQARTVERFNHPAVQVRFESWRDHEPEQLYDGIISVGAFEHFATRALSEEHRIAVYRAFFQRCRAWLRRDGALSLQTIAYDNFPLGASSEFLSTEVFPESQLPRLHEIVRASQGLFSVVRLRNDPEHYLKTLRSWRTRLRARRVEAVALVGDETVQRYERYLGLSMLGFAVGNMALLRITLRRNDVVRARDGVL
jgi:cyclopropane-fatty-acyl-phospholipid synthase